MVAQLPPETSPQVLGLGGSKGDKSPPSVFMGEEQREKWGRRGSQGGSAGLECHLCPQFNPSSTLPKRAERSASPPSVIN